jgi:hypothetical protein
MANKAAVQPAALFRFLHGAEPPQFYDALFSIYLAPAAS